MKMSLPLPFRVLASYGPSNFPAVFPFSQRDLVPHDNAPAADFYTYSRLVNHIDDHAVKNLQKYYGAVLPYNAFVEGHHGTLKIVKILDICSSWVSHIPHTTDPWSLAPRNQVVGIGMNAKELAANGMLSHWVVHDLDLQPDFRNALKSAVKGEAYPALQKLISSADNVQEPTAEGPFDGVICNVSIDYLSRPLEVMEQVAENLKPGAWAYMAISNRCFPSKVVRPWLNLSTEDRLHLVASYFYFAGTAYNPTEQKNTKAVGSVLKRLREASPAILPSEASEANSDSASSAEKGVGPGRLFHDIQAIVLVEEDNPEGWDPLWIVRGRRKE